MTIEFLPEKVEKLESVFLNILYLKPDDRVVAPNMSNLADLRNAINSIFDENKCTDVIYTLNTDKQFFGVRVNPLMSSEDATIILSTDEKVRLVKYQIEFDSKLFDIGLTESEIAAVTIYEIASIMDNCEIFEKLRYTIDSNLVSNDDILSIRDSINHAQLIIFAIKDTLYKLSSILFKNDLDELTSCPVIQAVEFVEDIISAKEKISSSVSGLGDSLRTDKPVILQWMFLMYRDMKINSGIIFDTLNDAKAFTGSKLEIAEINKTIDAIKRIDITIEESNLNKFLDKKNLSALNEISIFKSLKKSGLRGIENDLYEFTMKVRNCDSSEEAYTTMRGINNRLGVLDDYIENEPLSPRDRMHWEDVANQYRELRIILSKKKLNQNQYGLFINYSALDKLDHPDA